MKIQILRALLFSTAVIGFILFFSTVAALPDTIEFVIPALMLVFLGFAGFRYLSIRHKDSLGSPGRTTAALLRSLGSLLMVIGALLSLGYLINLIMLVWLAFAGDNPGGYFRLITLGAVMLVFGLVLLWGGRAVRRAHPG